MAQLIGITLIALGLVLVFPFVKPYLKLVFSVGPTESEHPPTPARPVKQASVKGGRIFIPAIKLSAPLVDDVNLLNYGIAHNSPSVLPGRKGNTVFTGHNLEKNGRPLFSLLHLVKKGDEVVLHASGRRFVYRVKQREIISPKNLGKFTKPSQDERLTLVTCYPPTSTAMRLIVIAKPSRIMSRL